MYCKSLFQYSIPDNRIMIIIYINSDSLLEPAKSIYCSASWQLYACDTHFWHTCTVSNAPYTSHSIWYMLTVDASYVGLPFICMCQCIRSFWMINKHFYITGSCVVVKYNILLEQSFAVFSFLLNCKCFPTNYGLFDWQCKLFTSMLLGTFSINNHFPI